MTRYQLPDWLGGHEGEALNQSGQGVLIELNIPDPGHEALPVRIIIDPAHLTEVKPEPPNGTILAAIIKPGSSPMVFARMDNSGRSRWYTPGENSAFRWADIRGHHMIDITPNMADTEKPQ